MNMFPVMVSGAALWWLHKASQKATEAQIIGLADQWLLSVCQGSPEAVVEHYAPNGVLVGTVAQNLKFGRPHIQTYFDTFQKKDRLCGRYLTHDVQIHDDWAMDNGVYIFQWYDQGKKVRVKARFSFVFRRTPDGWKISLHHSSKIPDPS